MRASSSQLLLSIDVTSWSDQVGSEGDWSSWRSQLFLKDDQNGHNSALQGFKRRDVVSEHGSATRDREVCWEDAQLCRPAQEAQGGLGDDLEEADDADDDSDSALDADVKIVI